MRLRAGLCRMPGCGTVYLFRPNPNGGHPPRYCPRCRAEGDSAQRAYALRMGRTPRAARRPGRPIRRHGRDVLRRMARLEAEAGRLERKAARREADQRRALARTGTCGCGRDYLTVPLEVAHLCPRPIAPTAGDPDEAERLGYLPTDVPCAECGEDAHRCCRTSGGSPRRAHRRRREAAAALTA